VAKDWRDWMEREWTGWRKTGWRGTGWRGEVCCNANHATYMRGVARVLQRFTRAFRLLELVTKFRSLGLVIRLLG
jgi:hypothetical protein